MEKNYNTKPKEYILEFLKNHKNTSFTVQEIYDEIIESG
jgi:Fe2+ or Zn2+ uptake regulation protein